MMSSKILTALVSLFRKEERENGRREEVLLSVINTILINLTVKTKMKIIWHGKVAIL